MQGQREPSMEDILASIKRVIAEEKELRAAIPPETASLDAEEEDVLELDQQLQAEAVEEAAVEDAAVDLGPPMMDAAAADDSRARLEALSSIAASAPPPPANPLEEMLKDMLRPALKAWLDEHLPRIVDEHVKKEISRITGRPL